MSNIENLIVMLDIASESNAHADVYKYSSQILELDINNSKAWISKGVAAAYLTDLTGNQIAEAKALISKGMTLGAEEEIKREASKQMRNAYTKFLARLEGELLEKVKDYQKVGMPKGGSVILHNAAQQANKLVSAQAQGLAKAKCLQLLVVMCNLDPTRDNYSYTVGALQAAKKHSLDNLNYLDSGESLVEFNAAVAAINGEIKSRFDDLEPYVNKITPPAKKDGCFIATAATGSYDHPKVLCLREFRDEYLLNKSWGASFIAAYYRISPPIAVIISKSNSLRRLVMLLVVDPAVQIANRLKHK